MDNATKNAAVTQILAKIEAGEFAAAEELLPLIYGQLRQLAAQHLRGERAGHTLQATALVHEAYLRLLGHDSNHSWESLGHFYAAASEAMRRVLVDSARAKRAKKRGGNWQRVQLDDFVDNQVETEDLLLDLDEGLGRLAEEDAESAELVKLRLFAGLSVTDAGRVLGMSRTVAYENWTFARSWFAAYLGRST